MPIALVGIIVLLGIAILLSENRRGIQPRVVIAAFGLQLGFAVLALKVPVGQTILASIAFGVNSVITYADAGIQFIFGPAADTSQTGLGFVFAIQVLTVIIFFSSLMAVLYYLRIMQLVVLLIGGFMRRVIGGGRIESLCAAANIFIGMVESPLMFRPYLSTISRSQLFAVMSTGLASVAGAVLVSLSKLGVSVEYLITAAFMAAPGGLLMGKLLVPGDKHDEEPEEKTSIMAVRGFAEGEPPANVIEAAADGAVTGVRLAANIGAMLLAFVALIALLNGILSGIGGWFGYDQLSFELILGYLFSPIVYLIGVPWEEAVTAGNFLGQKIMLNEFIAFVNFVTTPEQLSEKTQAIITFALCGFANLSGIAIIVGGLGTLIPARKTEVSKLGVKAVIAGTLSNLMSAAIASVLLSF